MKQRNVKRILSQILVLMLVFGLVPAEVFAAGGPGTYYVNTKADLTNALSQIASGQTIVLTGNINYNDTITIDGKDITFDLNGFNLNVYKTTGVILTVENNANVRLSDNTGGVLNIIGQDSIGVLAKTGGKVVVSNVFSAIEQDSDNFVGVEAIGAGSSVTVLNEISVVGQNTNGVYAREGGSITVKKLIDVEGSSSTAILATGEDSLVTALGDVRVKGYKTIGVEAEDGANVTVDKYLSSQAKYIAIDSRIYYRNEGVNGTDGNSEYLLYTDGKSTIRIKNFIFDSATGTITGYNGADTTIEIPVSISGVAVHLIGENAFRDASSEIKITSIIVPEGVTTLEKNAFAGCESLISVVLPESLINMGAGVFSGDSSLLTVNIPSSLTSIPDNTFSKCGNLVNMPLPVNIDHIGNNSFEECFSLKKVDLPANITTIGKGAFYYCQSLENITLPENLTSIEENTFAYCYELLNIVLPSKLTNIGDSAFESCYKLNSISIPSGVTSIGKYAFHNCDLIKDIIIPASVTEIGEYAFANEITTVLFMGDNAPILESESIFNDVAMLYYPSTAGDTQYTIDNHYSDSNCKSYDPTAKYTVTYDMNDSVSGSSITVEKLTPGYITLGGQGDLVKDGYRFLGWNTGEDGSGTTYAPGSEFLLVGVGEVTLYAKWSPIYTITVDPSVTNGSITPSVIEAVAGELIDINVTPADGYHLEDGTLEYTDSDGAMNYGDQLKYSFHMPSKNVTITGTFKSGEFSFDEDSKTILTYHGTSKNVVVPSEIRGIPVEYISENTFNENKSMTSIVLPNSLKTIEMYGFYDCIGLTEVSLPDSLTDIGAFAFQSCESLQSIIIPSSVKTIGGWAFDACTALRSVFFKGDAPENLGNDILVDNNGTFNQTNYNLVVSYINGSTGFTSPTWLGYQTRAINPIMLQSVVADGTTNSATSTKIDLIFDQAIMGLTANNIIITDGTGAVIKGALTGAGTNWSMTLSSVTTQGNISVAATAPIGYAVSGSPITVAIYKKSVINNDSNQNNNSNQNNTPVAPQVNSTPTIQGSTASGWSEITKVITANIASGNEQDYTMVLNGNADVPRQLFKDIQGTDVTVTFVIAPGIEWIVNGNDVTGSTQGAGSTEVSSINLMATLGSSDVPDNVIKDLKKVGGTVTELSLAFEGSFGFTATLRVNLAQTKSGQMANLFYYNPVTGHLEFQAANLIDANGNALLPFVHASDYVILSDNGELLKTEMENIAISTVKKTLYLGGTKDKSITLTPTIPQSLKSMITSGSATQTTTYESSNPQVAMVLENGKVIAKKEGNTTITTTLILNGITKSFVTEITVKKAYIKLTKSKKTLKTGETFTFKVVGYGVDIKNVIWSTKEKSIVVIDKKTGKAIAVSSGTDYVVATVGKNQIEVEVTVKK